MQRFYGKSGRILGLVSLRLYNEGHFLLLGCPINQPPAWRGSFFAPVTTSDCLGCNTSITPSSQKLIISLTWQETIAPQEGMELNTKKKKDVWKFDIFFFFSELKINQLKGTLKLWWWSVTEAVVSISFLFCHFKLGKNLFVVGFIKIILGVWDNS